ncbi:MAG: hypothetical protein NTU60_07770 [Candidatus Aminicenantes bacterium]|nr:hypothetical protein [Candidatus Aminicenantes bacterium]
MTTIKARPAQKRCFLSLVLILAGFFFVSPLHAQRSQPDTLKAMKTGAAIKLDGVLDEPESASGASTRNRIRSSPRR